MYTDAIVPCCFVYNNVVLCITMYRNKCAVPPHFEVNLAHNSIIQLLQGRRLLDVI